MHAAWEGCRNCNCLAARVVTDLNIVGAVESGNRRTSQCKLYIREEKEVQQCDIRIYEVHHQIAWRTESRSSATEAQLYRESYMPVASHTVRVVLSVMSLLCAKRLDEWA